VSRAPPAAAGRFREQRETPRAAVRRLFLRLRQRFLEGRAGIGPRAWRAWWIAIGSGAVGLGALTVILVAATHALLTRGALTGEAELLVRLANSGPLGFSGAVFFQALGTDTTLVMLVTVTAGIAAWNRRPITSLSIIAAFVVVDVAVRFGWLIWARPRPEVVHGGIAAPGLAAFPSGHTAKSVAVYGFLALLWIRASGSVVEKAVAIALAGMVAVAVAISRLRMGAHWPSDIVAGAILGSGFLAVLGCALRFERQVAGTSHALGHGSIEPRSGR
jgi:membrane-associated phospholipid phosphatase